MYGEDRVSFFIPGTGVVVFGETPGETLSDPGVTPDRGDKLKYRTEHHKARGIRSWIGSLGRPLDRLVTDHRLQACKRTCGEPTRS